MKYRDLYKIAEEVRKNSYAPFSKFRVGAALLTKDGKVYTGVNVENSSFGGTICAERTAFCKAISEGDREFEAIAVTCDDGEALPCGICRQFMREFVDDDFKIIVGVDVEHLEVFTQEEILPKGFKF